MVDIEKGVYNYGELSTDDKTTAEEIIRVLQNNPDVPNDVCKDLRLKFNIEDIAHSLSNLCRFNGHTSTFYSVAQHSVLVSCIVPREHALAALLHDAAEAYCGDVVSPLKALLPVYQAIHNDIERTIFLQLGLEYPAPACVRDADIVALATEVRDLMPNNPALWHNISDIEPHHEIIKPWTPESAKEVFLQRYFDLQSKNIQQAS